MIVILIVLLFIVIACILLYNRLTSSRQHVNESWADIDVQLKRRHDLIPNLVTTVQAYATHEKDIFEQVAKSRSDAINLPATDVTSKSDVETELANNVRTLLAVAENYPQLKASEDFLKLQDQLVKTEDEIASARRIYNDNVADYNTLVKIFPINIIAGVLGFSQASFFQNV